MNSKTLIVLIVTLVFIVTGAQRTQATVESYSLGAGIGIVPDYEGSSDYQAVPIPYAKVNWDNGMSLELTGLKLKAALLRYDAFSLGPMANYRIGRDDVDNDKVDRLKDVDDSLELGAFVGFEMDRWNAAVEILQDIADGHEGLLMTLRGGYAWPVNDTMMLSIGASTTYADDDYMDSFFGIDNADSARSGLKTFDAEGGFKDIGFNLGMGYRMTDTWRLQAIASLSRLLGDAADSPVVDDEGSKNQLFAGVVFIYTFGKKPAKPVEVEPYHF